MMYAEPPTASLILDFFFAAWSLVHAVTIWVLAALAGLDVYLLWKWW